MSSWLRKFHHPVYPRTGKPIETRADARAFILRLGDRAGRNEWQYAIAALLECLNGGSCYAARDAIENALFLNMMLDLERA